MEPIFFTNLTENLTCETCNVKCSRPSEWKRHILTLKHKKRLNGNNVEVNFTTKKEYNCDCGKVYKNHSGLWKHKKICSHKKTLPVTENPLEMAFLTNLVMEVVKNNSELQKQNHDLQQKVLDACSKNNNGTYISQNNSHNKTFNLQFFLNEQCKDAMNLTEFIDTMTLEFSDLEDVGKLGYVEGIIKIMIRKLNELDIYKRPIHCSDAKREIMYVKEHNVWEKEKNSNEHIRKAIKRVTHKNGGLLVPWSLENPNCMNLDHHLNDVYLRMMGQSMGGSGEFFDNENKIMKKIAKAVVIDK